MKIEEVHWEITTACNLECSHCLLDIGAPRPHELTTEEALKVIKKIRDWGSAIYFTGGEPFYRKDFSLLLAEIGEKGIQASILTNGTLLNNEILQRLRDYGFFLGISLDGACSSTNNDIRGERVFRKVLCTIDRCKEMGVNFSLYVTITERNYDELEEIGKLAKFYDSHVHYNEVSSKGRAQNNKEILLSEKRDVFSEIRKVSEKVFGKGIEKESDKCTVSGRSLFMSSEGNLFPCVEIAQERPDLNLGNIRTIHEIEEVNFKMKKCCYEEFQNEKVKLIKNTKKRCPFAPSKDFSIDSLPVLYEALGKIYERISDYCSKCYYPDCVGYIWLLPEEAKSLYKKGVEIVEINETLNFISFLEGEKISLSLKSPPCSQLIEGKRKCGIYKDRPLVCRLYPIGLEVTSSGKIVWALYNDCLYSKRKKEKLKKEILSIIESLSPALEKKIITTYHKVSAVTHFPEGENSFEVLREVNLNV